MKPIFLPCITGVKMVPFTKQARKYWRRQDWEVGSGSGYIEENEEKIIQLRFLGMGRGVVEL